MLVLSLLVIGVIGSIILMIATLKYPAVSIAFLIMAGVFKGILISGGFRFRGFLDPVILGGAWVAIVLMYNYVRTNLQLRDIMSVPLGIYLALIAFLFFGLMYTSAPNYGFEKSLKFATIVFVMFLAPIVLAFNLKDLKVIIWLLFILGILYTAGMIIAPKALGSGVTGAGRTRFMEVGPLGTAAQIAMAAIVAFCFTLLPCTSARLKTVSIILMPLMFISIIKTGSRGPLLGLWLCVVAALFLYRKYVSKIWSLVVVGATIAAIFLVFAKLPFEKTVRIRSVVRDRYKAEKVAFVRTEMFRWVWKNAGRHPFFGHGTGAYAFDRNGVDRPDWPHNIILELLYEQGIAGLFLLALFLWLIFKHWRRAAKLIYFCDPSIQIEASMIVHISGLLYLFNLAQAMKSFDIVGNRLTFFCAGIVLAASNCVRRMANEPSLEEEFVTDDWQPLESGVY